MSGFRARKAQKIFEDFGFNNTKVYDGSFENWILRGGEVVH
jgi:rhodanese-related sulfurtransferase